MRKFSVNIHYDVVMPVEIEAINEEDALNKAKEMELDIHSKYLDAFMGNPCVTDVEAKDNDFEETINELVELAALDDDYGKYSVEELFDAAKEVVSFGSDYFEQYTKEDLVYVLFEEADRMREDLKKTMEKCRGENF